MLIIVSFFATFGLLVSAGLLLFYRDTVMDRLQAIVEPHGSSLGFLGRLLERKPTSLESIVKPFQNVLPRSVAEASIVQKRLIRAGYRDASAINIFYGSKVLVPIGLSALATVTGLYQMGPLFVYAIAAGLGFMVPDFW